ncbi:MAG: hypothetical protein WD751_10000 [Anaerolineales bacterium]
MDNLNQLTTILAGLLSLLLPFIILYQLKSGNDEQLINEGRVLSFEKEREKNKKRPREGSLTEVEKFSAFAVFLVYRLFILTSFLWVILKTALYPFGYLLFRAREIRVLIGLRYSKGPLRGLSEKSYDHVVREVSKILENGVEIYGSFGELGHLMFESGEILSSLKKAYKKNKAKIKLSHGPIVDPKTKRIFSLAKKGVIRIHETSNYYHSHFILVRTKDDQRFVVDEQVHDEALWDSKSKKLVYDNKSRLVFLYPANEKLWRNKLKVFDQRYGETKRLVKQNPGLRKTQEITVIKTMREFLWYNIFLGNLLQPLAILFGRQSNIQYK